MMMIKEAALSIFLSSLLAVDMVQAEKREFCSAPGTMTCYPIDTTGSSTTRTLASPPVLDGDASEWADVKGGINAEVHSIYGTTYEEGDVSFKCVYDTEKIYL